MCNFGERERLTAGGLRFDPVEPSPPEGSCIAVCACDAPMTAQQLRRLALRPLLGLARAGSYAHNGSGEIAVAFTTAHEQTLENSQLNPFFAAAYEAAEEAVYNCLVAERPPMRKRDGREHPQQVPVCEQQHVSTRGVGARQHGLLHLGRGLDADQFYGVRCRQGDRADECHLSAPPGELGRHRVTLLA